MHRNIPRDTTGSDIISLQWSNGKSVARTANTDTRFMPLVGWHIEMGRSDLVDQALHTANTARIEIKHQRPGGAEIKPHWYLSEQIVVYLVTAGPYATTIGGLLREPEIAADSGIGVAWPAGERSRLALRGYLAATGPDVLLSLGVRSKMSDELLKALLDHARVCAAADALVDRAKHPDEVAFHEVGLPLGAGAETEWGKDDTATVVPFVAQHPAEATREYIVQRWRAGAIDAAARRDWPEVQRWAAEFARERDELAGGGGGFGR
jgi:hypothetical protein